MLGTGGVLLVAAIIAWAFSFRLIVGKRADLIAGYDPEQVSDPDGYARLIGWGLLLCGVGILLTWILVASGRMQSFSPGLLISVLVPLLFAFIGSRRYARREENAS